VEPQQLLALIVGAFFGSMGWLVVGIYMQRRAAQRQARSAARAVYFELAMNETDISVAAEHGVFQSLRRGAFDRLLPDLATWLSAQELNTIVTAYMSQSGYDQSQRDERLPGPVRAAVLGRVLSEHRAATELLRKRAFNAEEAASLIGDRGRENRTDNLATGNVSTDG
jgi:hypothetical protein